MARHRRCRVRSIRNVELVLYQPTSFNIEIKAQSMFLVPAAPSFVKLGHPQVGSTTRKRVVSAMTTRLRGVLRNFGKLLRSRS